MVAYEDKISLHWTVGDVLYVCPHLTKDQAREVLHEAYRKYDPQYGICWDTFTTFASMMFSEVE